MSYRSKQPPHCRYCGKPIPKYTNTHFFSWTDDAAPLSLADCQQLTNQQVVSVRYGPSYRNGQCTGRQIRVYSTWDGESYRDQFFCNDNHAKLFGYAAARWNDGHLSMGAYRKAMAQYQTNEGVSK